MNKLLCLCLLGFVLVALSDATKEESENNLKVRDSAISNVVSRITRDANAKKRKSSKKNKKNKSKRTGKKRSQRKNKKGNKEKKQKKDRKKKNKNKNKKSKKSGKTRGLRQSTCAVSDDCMTNAVTYMNIVKDKVKNFEKQMKRIVSQNTTGGKKSGKKDDFKPVLTRLINAAGGNKSAPMCGSSSNGTAVDQIKNLTSTLQNCSVSVMAACDPSNLPQPNMTAMTACSTKLKSFEESVTNCTKKTGAEACSCWTDSSLSNLRNEIKTCSLSDEANAFAKAIKSCVSSFGVCRKYEDEVSNIIYACEQNPAQIKQKLNALTANSDAVKKAQAKAASLAARNIIRLRRAVPTNCADVISKSEELITMVEQNPAAATIKPLADEIAATGSVSCSAAEKTSLKSVDSKFNATSEIIKEAIDNEQATLAELTGSTASTNEIAQATTAAPSNMTTSAQATTAAPSNMTTSAQATTASPSNMTTSAQATTAAPSNMTTSAQATAALTTTAPTTAPTTAAATTAATSAQTTAALTTSAPTTTAPTTAAGTTAATSAQATTAPTTTAASASTPAKKKI